VLFTFHILQDLEYQQPGADVWRQVGVAAGGPGQVVFALRAPEASFPLTLRVGIIPKHIFAGMAPAQIASSPYSGLRAFGTGPFKVGSINQLAIFNPDGDGKAFFSDPHVRQALVQAVDRQRLVSEVLAGRADADPNPIPTANWAYSAAAGTLHPYDAIAAARALDAAGWVADPSSKIRAKKGAPFKVSMVAADSYPNQQVADGIARQLRDIGVQVDVKALPASKLLQENLLTHKYQMALISVDVGPDPDQYWLWHSGMDAGSLNFAY